MTDTSTLATDFERDGYVILRGLYTDSDMDRWCEELEALRTAGPEENPSGVSVWFLPNFPEFFLEQFRSPTLVDPIKAILGPDVEFLSAKPVIKSPKHRFPSPWHQDYAYWGGANKLSAWIAMDDATPENGCLKVVRGGHSVFVPHGAVAAKEGFENRLTDETLPAGEVVDCVMKRGDAIIFSDLCPHCSYPNTAGIRRWSMIPTYRPLNPPDTATVWKQTLRV